MAYDTSYIDYYTYKNIRVYKFSYDHSNYKNETLVKTEKAIHYFVRSVDSLYGRDFDTAMHMYNVRNGLVSHNYIQSFTDLHFNDIMDSLLQMKLVWSKKDMAAGTLHEKYEVTTKQDTAYKMIWHLAYSNAFTNNTVSLSSFMDSIKKMHLYEVTVINPSKTIKEKNLAMSEWVNSTKMEKINCSDKEMVLHYVDAYLKAK